MCVCTGLHIAGKGTFVGCFKVSVFQQMINILGSDAKTKQKKHLRIFSVQI